MSKIHDGKVSDSNDPKGLARVRAFIPGVCDNQSDWLYPLGVSIGENMGEFNPPEKGELIGVFFINGNPNNGRYIKGGFSEQITNNDTPPNSYHGTDGTNAVYADRAIRVERDTRTGTKGIRVVAQDTDETILEYDSNTHRMLLYSSTGIEVKTDGELKLTGGLVSINNRQVNKGSEPI